MPKMKAIFLPWLKVICLIFSSFLLTNSLQGQISVPRAGYPYCEPFTNATARPNTVFGGSPSSYLSASNGTDPDGGGVLRLTNAANGQRGYVFIDLPFSFSYGLKFSFEYFAYGGTVATPADGLSVFLFDGAIDASTFQIGGIGGSLSYAPLVVNDVSPALNQPGLKGAYMGIGFDSFYNWGNNYEGKNGGFLNPSAPGIPLTAPANSEFYQTIAIRGPEDPGLPGFNPYQFIVGKRVNNGPELGADDPDVFHTNLSDYLYPNVADKDRRFPINSPSRVEVCMEDGYRKVFVDLRPNGFKSYLLSVYMLVNTASAGLRVETIVENVPYSFPTTPDNLKLGFAASTGSFNNFHEIRNVVVEVSDLVNIPLPEVEDLNAEICVGEENLFEFEVTLESLNSFVQCLQLYDAPPAPPYNVFSTPGPPSISDCGFNDAVCQEACKSENSLLEIPGKGTFYAVFDENVDVTDEEDRKKAAIRFVPEDGFVGEATAYYQVIDNYGLFSEPKQIRIISNPFPEIKEPGTIDYPSCDGQNDGEITGIVVENLVPGFDYNLTWNVSGTVTDLGKTNTTLVSFDPLTGEATFDISQINLGLYTLTVFNPSDEDGCPVTLPITVNQENGTPVELEPYVTEICEGTPASITPTINPIYNPNNLPVPFVWYTTADRSSGPLPTNGPAVIGGVNVEVSISSDGSIEIIGLEADGLTPKDYTLYVETSFQNNPGAVGNFCPFIGEVATEATITVFPALEVTKNETPDWCREGIGEVSISALGGNGDKTFILFDASGNQVETQTDPTSVTFSGLLPGTYSVDISSENPTCIENETVVIQGPAIDLSLAEIAREAATCDSNNGTFTFEVAGGNGTLSSSNISISGGLNAGLTYNSSTDSYTYSGLEPGVNYTVTVTDERNCSESVSFTIDEIQTPTFSLFGPTEVCEDQSSVEITVSNDFFELNGIAVPVFNWYSSQTGGSPISNGTGPSGLTYSIDNATGNLSISGLIPTTLTIWLEMAGPDACNLDRKPYSLTINPLPEADFTPANISCFNGSDGTLEVIGVPLGSGPFTYELIQASSGNVIQTETDGTFSGLTAGEYRVRIINDATACEYLTGPYTLTEPTALEIQNVIPTPTTCGLPNNGQIILTVAGGTAPYSFVSISRGGTPLSGLTPSEAGTTYTFSDLEAGDYVIIFKDANGCEVTENELIGTTPVPDISIAVNPEFCFGDPIVVTPTITEVGTLVDPVTYTWVVNGTTLNAPNGTFAGGTYTISTSAGINPPTLTLINIQANSYTFTLQVRGTGSCDLDFSENTTVNPLPDTQFEVQNALCFGGFGSISLSSGGESGHSYVLNTGETNTTGIFPDLPAGDYTIVVTNSFGCTQTINSTITQPDELRITPVDFSNPTCEATNGVIVFDLVGGVEEYEIEINGTALNSTNFDFSRTGNTYTIENLAPGSYAIGVTDTNLCTLPALDLFQLVNDNGFDVQSLPIQQEICEGGTASLFPQLTIPAGANPVLNWFFDASATQPITSSSNPAADGQIYEISASGELTVSNLQQGSYTYYLKISGTNICEQITEATVTVIPPIEATATPSPVTCFEDSNGSIQVSAPTGGNGTYEFSLDGSTWQPASLFEGLIAGSYTVYVRDNSGLDGCLLAIPDIIIDTPSAPIEENQGVELPVSCGLDNGAVRDVLVTGGWGNYTFEWRKDDPTTGSVLSQGTITGIEDLAQGTYFLIITDDLGCVAVFDYTIGVASDPVYELVDPIDACFGSPIQINPIHIAPDPSLPPSAATEIRWYKGPGQTELISNGPDAADPSVIYTIDDTDWLNPALKIENLPVGTHDFYFYVVCTGQEIKIDIVVFDTPAVVFESDPVSCFGESDGKIRLVSGTNTEYTYSINGATAISQAELEALTFAAGNYSIQVNTPAGCPQVVDVEVEGPSGPLEIQLVSQLDPSCNLDNGQILLRLLGGNPDYVLTMNGSPVTGFDLSQDGTEILFENLAGGTYQFEISDQKACAPASASITLTPLEVPEFDAQGDEICAFDPTSGTPNTGVLTPVIVNQAGSTPVFNWYYVNASGTEVLINSGDAVLGGTANVTASGQLELTGLASQDDPYLFYLEVLGDLVCPGPKIEAPLQVNFTPEVVFEKMDILCFGETTGRIAVQSGALPGFTYTLNSGETNDAGTFENLPAGTYTVEVSNGTSCIQSVQIEIEQPDELVINAIDFTDPTCDAINGEFIFSITGGIETYSIAINGQELNTSNFTFAENSGVYTVQNLTPGTYSISVTDANGCSVEAPDLFTLTNNPGINIDSNPISEEICEGEVGQLIPDLTFPSGVNPVLRWYRDASASQEIVSSSIPDQNGIVYQINSQGVLSITGLPDGVFEYYLRISGPGICTQITPATLSVTARPEVTIQADNISCFGANDGRVSVASGHDASYVYSLSNGNSNSTGEFSGLTPGNYTLEVENTSGCIQILNFEIEEPAELIISPVDFTNPTCDEENGEIIFEVIGGTGDYTILINGLELNDSNFAFIQSGNSYQVKGLGPNAYSIEVRDENACSKTEADLFTLVNESGILIGSNPLFEEIMLGEIGVLTPDLTIPSGAVFELNWYFDANATQIITSSPSPAADGVTYQIDGNGELTVTDLPPGTYTYYYEISGDGICVTLTEAVLVVKSPLTADIITTDVTCFGGSDGSISVENIDGGTPPLSFSLDAVNWQSSPRFEDLPVGMYTVYISDATISVGFLTSFQNIEITTTATEIVANVPDLIPAQCDLPNGAIRNLLISGGTGTYTFEWRKDDPVSGEVQSGGALSGIENVFPGTYYLSVTDSNGCQEVFEFEVEELPDPVYEVVPPIDICLGESAVIQPVFIAPNPPTPTAASEIRWYKDAGQIGLVSNGPDPENASILYAIDDSDGINPVLTIENLPVGVHDFYFYVVCTGQEIKVDVTVYEIPQMAFETSPVTCFGDSNGKISAISGSLPDYTYSLNGATPGSLQDLESLNLTAGDYSLDVITPAGCAQSLSVTIEGPEAPLTLADLNPIDPGCGADNGRIRAQITGGWAPYTINLYREGSLLTSVTQSDSNLLFENLSIGTYLIEIIDDKGCRIESPVIDLVDGPTQILVDDQEACEGAVITLVPRLDPPVAVYTVQWFFDAAATQPIVSSPTPAADGVIYEIAADGTLTMTGLPYSPTPYQYFATATGPDVCVGFLARPRVKINEIPAFSATIIEEQCFGSGGIIEITATGGSGGYEYSVDGITFQASNTFNLQPGTYDITVRTGQGCEAVISGLVITGPPAPIAIENLSKVDATCGQEDGSLSFTVQGGYGGYEVDLLLDGNLVHTATTEADGSIAFSGLAKGIYTVVVRDTGGCEISFENLTEIQNVPTLINVNDEMICEGESATLIPNVPTSSPDLQFTWYLDAQATQPVQNGPTGDVTYTIGADGSLTVSGLAPSATPYEYFVWASGTDICRDIPEKASILVTALPNLRVSNPSIVCDPTGTVDLTDYIQGFNPTVYDYNVISPVGTTMRLEDLTDVNQSGSYLVSSSAKGTGCWNQPQRILVVIAETLLEAEFNYLVDLGGGNIFQNQDIPLGEDVYFNDLSRGNAVKWTWDFGDGFTSEEQNPVHNYDEVGTFTVQLRVLDSIGCISIYEMVVNVLDDFKVIIPNAFTPQGTKNQYFKPEFRGISSMEFYIFNTWGELIYQTNSLEDLGWDGTLNGKDAPNGNYVYRGRFVSRGGEVIEKSGVFMLIR